MLTLRTILEQITTRHRQRRAVVTRMMIEEARRIYSQRDVQTTTMVTFDQWRHLLVKPLTQCFPWMRFHPQQMAMGEPLSYSFSAIFSRRNRSGRATSSTLNCSALRVFSFASALDRSGPLRF